MSEKLLYLVQRLLRKTWVRCSLFSLLAVLAVALSKLLGPWIPEALASRLGSDSTSNLLNIMATSMLTVAVFSATAMVSSFATVASSATPRASQLMIEDSTIQNTLATFIGAFLFSVIALIGLNAKFYDGGGRLVLFGFTVLIMLTVVVVLLRWIDYLSGLGRMGETIGRVEKATCKAMQQRACHPWLGGQSQADGARGLYPVLAPKAGFVQHVSMDILQACAEKHGDTLHLHVLPGAFVEPSITIVSGNCKLDAAGCKAITDAVLIGSSRTFDHDPRFGLVVLGEIATRALSPAVNDPGTARDVMATALRALIFWVEQVRQQEARRVKAQVDAQRSGVAAQLEFDRVTAPALREAGLLDDAFAPLARYGETAVEVGVALQQALASIRRLNHPAFNVPAARLSAYAIDRATHAGLLDSDLQRLREAANG